jgi:hypothetical protein
VSGLETALYQSKTYRWSPFKVAATIISIIFTHQMAMPVMSTPEHRMIKTSFDV